MKKRILIFSKLSLALLVGTFSMAATKHTGNTVFALGEAGNTRSKCHISTASNSSSDNSSPSETTGNGDAHTDVSVEYSDNTAPIGKANAKKLAQATAEAGKKVHGFTIDPGLIYAQWVQESGADFNANGTLNNDGHNLGGLSAPVPSWLAAKGAKTGSTHAEGDGSYIYFPDYKTFAEAYVSGYYPAVPKALKAGSKGGNGDADITAFVTELKNNGYFTAEISAYIPGVQSAYATFYNATDIASDIATATGTGQSSEDDICGVVSDVATSNLQDIAKNMVGYFVGNYLQVHNPSLVSSKNDNDSWSVSDVDKNGSTDCSGFVWTVMKVAGYNVPPGMAWNTLTMAEDAKGDQKYLKAIDKSNAKAGTIVTAGGTGNAGHTVILAEDWHGDDTLCYSMGSDEGVVERAYKFVMASHPAETSTFCVPSSESSKGSSSSDKSNNSSEEESAKKWIMNKESRGSYTARNGRYYGAYQLDLAYLNGDLSKENQDKTAESYMRSRYGSWVKAKQFWESNNWW